MKISELALLLDGEVKGDPDTEIRGAAGIHDVGEGEVTFLARKNLLQDCAESAASCVIVNAYLPELPKTQIIVANPQYAFAKVLEHFYVRPSQPSGVSPLAYVSEKAAVGRDVTVYPFAHIGDSTSVGDGTVIYPGVFIGNGTTIGTACIIYPSVTIREGITIGNRVIIHPGAVIGADGFGYVFEQGRHYKIPQVGGVVIGDDVEIGANATIDRATTGNTVIGRGTKIDNLVQVGHNVRIGEDSILVAQVAIGGSTEIGNFVMLGGQVAIADHSTIDDGCMVAAKSGIMGHLTKGVYAGSPAFSHREWLKASSLFARLPELHRKIRDLEEKITSLERRHSA